MPCKMWSIHCYGLCLHSQVTGVWDGPGLKGLKLTSRGQRLEIEHPDLPAEAGGRVIHRGKPQFLLTLGAAASARESRPDTIPGGCFDFVIAFNVLQDVLGYRSSQYTLGCSRHSSLSS